MDFKKIQTIAFFTLLIGVGIIFYQMIEPYVFAIFWAAIIASLFHPLYRRINKRIKNDNASAALTLVAAILVVIIPLAGVFTLVVTQAVETYTQLNNPETIASIQRTAEGFLEQPYMQSLIGEVDVRAKVREMASGMSSTALDWLKAGSQSTLSAIISTLVMLYALYYFLKDGKKWLKHLMHLLPFGDKNERILYEKFASTGKATLKGTILLGGIQGAIGGIMFWIVGVPAAAFWGLVMIVLSIIPAIGAFLIIYPAAIYLLVIGDVWQAVVLAITGGVVGVLDNLLRPPLVGKDIEMHPMIIFFATIGGLAYFGISGVVVGPIIAAFFFAVLQMYEQKYKKQLDSGST